MTSKPPIPGSSGCFLGQPELRRHRIFNRQVYAERKLQADEIAFCRVNRCQHGEPPATSRDLELRTSLDLIEQPCRVPGKLPCLDPAAPMNRNHVRPLTEDARRLLHFV